MRLACQLLALVDPDIISLLNHAHFARAEAARARRLAPQQVDRETRRIVARFGRQMDERAAELEASALSIVPASLKLRALDGLPRS